MRAIRLAAVGAALGLVAMIVAPAAHAAGHWYDRIDLSYNHLADHGWVSPNGGVDTQSKNGMGLDLALGRDLGRVWAGGGIRGEFELKWKYNDVKALSDRTASLTGITGHTRIFALMYNLYDDFLPDSTFDPYVGAGIGYASVRFGNYYGYDATTHTEYALDSSDSVFAYQAFVGFKVRLQQSLALDMAYNWFWTSNPKLSEGTGSTQSSYRADTLTLGLDWTF